MATEAMASAMELDGAVAVLRLCEGKANAMSEAWLRRLDELLDALTEAVDGGAARAAVLTGYDRFFSAGLALPLLAALERPAMKAFMERWSRTMLRVFRLPLPVVAAVNGHAIAGGCVLALMADHRVMVEGEGKIGLNEVQLGLSLPTIVIEALRAQLAPRAAMQVALEGGLMSPHVALELGLVDEVVVVPELLRRAVERAAKLAASPRLGYAQLKEALRRPALEAIARSAAEDDERWLDSWFSPAARERREAALARMAR